jgi:predicted HAD superfamily Cof-like phosphohydrolase
MRPTDDLVREFHEAAGQTVNSHPIIPDADLVRFRLRLIKEEFKEVEEELHALLGKQSAEESLATLGNLLKELCDLRYVLDGTAVSLGLPYADAYREVHRSNMSKLQGGAIKAKSNGQFAKVAKGTYTPADMSKFIPPIIEGESA